MSDERFDYGCLDLEDFEYRVFTTKCSSIFVYIHTSNSNVFHIIYIFVLSKLSLSEKTNAFSVTNLLVRLSEFVRVCVYVHSQLLLLFLLLLLND